MPTLHPKKCRHCRTSFRPATARALFCDESCRKAASKHKQRATQEANFPNLAFGNYLISECVRAGTVQILQSVDLSDLYSLWCFYNKANGFNVDEEFALEPRYELSHICPAAGVPGFIGLLHPLNLVVAPATYNRRRASHWKTGTGKFLRASDLKPEWSTVGRTRADIAKMIKKVNPTFGTLLEEHKLSYKTRIRYINHLIKMNVETRATLEAMPLEQLETLYEMHPKMPRKKTMARRLATLTDNPERAEARYMAMSEPDLQSAYLASPASRNAYSLKRWDAYEVFCCEAHRLGVAVPQEWLLIEYGQQCWSALHGEDYGFDPHTEEPENWCRLLGFY